jgi:hypothetical protein
MTTRLLIVGGLVLVAVVIALVAQRRRPTAPTNPGSYTAPAQLDRADFGSPAEPWLVVVFTSATCDTCAGVWSRAEALRSDAVAVIEVEAAVRPDLQQRYGIEAVPITVIADDEGVVRRSFVGPVSSTHLWAAVAEVREPGSVPEGCSTGEDPAQLGGVGEEPDAGGGPS